MVSCSIKSNLFSVGSKANVRLALTQRIYQQIEKEDRNKFNFLILNWNIYIGSYKVSTQIGGMKFYGKRKMYFAIHSLFNGSTTHLFYVKIKHSRTKP